MKLAIVTAALTAIVALASACTIGSGTDLVYNAADDDLSTTSSSAAGVSCTSGFVTPDLSTLTACSMGRGHCYDADKVPTIGTLDKCANNQVCVPDTILEAGGKTPLKTCNSVIDKPGACVSMAIQEINAKSNQLTQDVCGDQERCVPCVNPLNGVDDGFCHAIGVHEATCSASTTAAPAADEPQPCCPTEDAPPQGVCMQGDNVPASQRDKVEQNVCAPGFSCVPAAFVNNDPVACSSVEGSGFCMDQCFTGDLGSRALLQGDCPNPRDKCVPCSVGKGEGLPGC